MQLRVLIAVAAGMLCAPLAQGSIILTLDNPIQSASPGSIVEFRGSIQNTGPESLGLIHVEFTPHVAPPPFETGIPLVLLFLFRPLPGDQYTGVVYAVQVDPDAASGQILGTTVTIEDPGGRVPASNGVPIRLTVAPEPASLLLVGGAVICGLAVRRRIGSHDATC